MAAVEVERNGAILELTIDRPKANAIDSATSRELGEQFVAFGEDPDLRVAIITGAGERFFSAGWDLKAAAAGDPEDFGHGGFAGLTELFDLDKPVIAAVNGFAAGGGFELALACDLVVAIEAARFSLPEVNRGSSPMRAGCSGCRSGCRARWRWRCCSPVRRSTRRRRRNEGSSIAWSVPAS